MGILHLAAWFTWAYGRTHTRIHTHIFYTLRLTGRTGEVLGRQRLTLFHRTILLLSANHDPLTYRPNINNSGSIFSFSLGNPTRPQYRIATDTAAAASQDAINHICCHRSPQHPEEDFRNQQFTVHLSFWTLTETLAISIQDCTHMEPAL